jgi:hypothetical protein
VDDKPQAYGADTDGVTSPSVVRRTPMSDHTTVLAVASYRSKAAAERDFDAIMITLSERPLDYAAAVVEKGADGTLTLDRFHHAAVGDALLGAALNVIAAPLGILLLAPAIVTQASGADVAPLVGHFWHHIPRDELFRMSNLLEAGQAAIAIVTVDDTTEDLRSLFSNATTALVTDPTVGDFSNAVDEPD